MTKMRHLKPVAALLLGLGAITGHAAVTADEAAKLKSTLTPLGAERAGNKEGTIPAWDGGYTKVPAGWKNGEPRPDPFAAEKPLFSVSAKNLASHEARVAEGVKALMRKYPNFRIDVYPTHRTHAAPQWVYDNTAKNATTAQLVDGGYGIDRAYGGIPFPIPKDGFELMMNTRHGWQGTGAKFPQKTWVVTSFGARTMTSGAIQNIFWPYYIKDGEAQFKGISKMLMVVKNAPSAVNGEAIMVHDPINANTPYGAWQYLVGQRRVRKAPSVAYDMPDTVTSGTGLFDEAFGTMGPIDRHGYKLLGKQEMYIPYNGNRSALAKVDDLVTPGHLNPDHVRWELHRVWVVEANLLPGKRHTMPKRRYYVDEDSWHVVLSEHFDAQGQPYHLWYSLGYLVPDMPGIVSDVMWGVYNLQTGQYYYNLSFNELPVHYPLPKIPQELNEGLLSPEAMAMGAR